MLVARMEDPCYHRRAHSLMQPLLDPNPVSMSTRRPRTRPGRPFDPEDLCRRLRIYERLQQEQEERARLRRANRARAQFHFSPEVATLDMKRTALPQLHRTRDRRWSQPVFGRCETNVDVQPLTTAAPLTATCEVEPEMPPLERCPNRRSTFVEDLAPEPYKATAQEKERSKRTRSPGRRGPVSSRPFSTGHIVEEEEEFPSRQRPPRANSDPAVQSECKHDLVQPDNVRTGTKGSGTFKGHFLPLLRRSSSMWVFGGKKKQQPVSSELARSPPGKSDTIVDNESTRLKRSSGMWAFLRK